MVVPSPQSPQAKISRRGLLRAAVRSGIGLGALGCSTTAWAAAEASWLEVNRLDVVLPRLPRVFDGFRIAQISDIHIEGGDMRYRLPDITKYVSSLGADMIALTGDYTTRPDTWQEDPLVEGLRHLQAPEGVFAVLGNHDQWLVEDGSNGGAELARSALKRARSLELDNDAVVIERSGEKLWICGINDWATGRADISPIAAKLPAGSCAVLLAHEPDFADLAAPMGLFDLMLSGHSHGGQIAFPFVGAVCLPWGARKYPRGRYQVGEMMLYTNCGLGVVDIPLRLCSRPEVTVFTLRLA